jgi:hypothetical protein
VSGEGGDVHVSEERDRLLWLTIRRALQQIVLAIEKRWGITSKEDLPH